MLAMDGAARVEETDAAHMTRAELESQMDWVRDAPAHMGLLCEIVRRPDVEQREVLEEARLDPRVGLVGDSWYARATGSSKTSEPDRDRQLTLMNWRFATLVAAGEERVALAGDQLYVDFDLSIENAPVGTRLQIGSATIELTEPLHKGCAKFVRRFGKDAMELVNSPVGRALRLRGSNAKVVIPGTVRVGDSVEKLRGDRTGVDRTGVEGRGQRN